MTTANLLSFIIETNRSQMSRSYPLQANRLTKIQAHGLYRDLQQALQHCSDPLKRTSLLRAWQDLRDLGFETDLDLPQ
jgi:hypothetical protein